MLYIIAYFLAKVKNFKLLLVNKVQICLTKGLPLVSKH